jgi:hypothetical protein
MGSDFFDASTIVIAEDAITNQYPHDFPICNDIVSAKHTMTY